jgi:hypothetical protein
MERGRNVCACITFIAKVYIRVAPCTPAIQEHHCATQRWPSSMHMWLPRNQSSPYLPIYTESRNVRVNLCTAAKRTETQASLGSIIQKSRRRDQVIINLIRKRTEQGSHVRRKEKPNQPNHTASSAQAEEHSLHDIRKHAERYLTS